jgi:hypothetical protein
MNPMGMIRTILLPIAIFAATYFILYIILSRLFPKFKIIKLRFKLAYLVGLSHFILATILCILINNNPEAMMIFAYTYLFNLIFLGYYIWLCGILGPVLSYNVANPLALFIAFGVMGSLTYAVLGLIVGRIVEIIKGVKGK